MGYVADSYLGGGSTWCLLNRLHSTTDKLRTMEDLQQDFNFSENPPWLAIARTEIGVAPESGWTKQLAHHRIPRAHE